MEPERYFGTIKWFSAEKGYRTLEEGQQVQFDMEQAAKGPKVANVTTQ